MKITPHSYIIAIAIAIDDNSDDVGCSTCSSCGCGCNYRSAYSINIECQSRGTTYIKRVTINTIVTYY